MLTMFYTVANFLRSMKMLVGRTDFGFFFENKRRGFTTFFFSLIQLPDFASFAAAPVANFAGIACIALAVVLAIMGFWVVDLEDTPASPPKAPPQVQAPKKQK